MSMKGFLHLKKGLHYHLKVDTEKYKYTTDFYEEILGRLSIQPTASQHPASSPLPARTASEQGGPHAP